MLCRLLSPVSQLTPVVVSCVAGSGSVDKPLATLWRNYCQSTKPDIEMRVTIAVSGLKATTREHGLTEYWSHRVTYAYAHPNYPKVSTARDATPPPRRPAVFRDVLHRTSVTRQNRLSGRR